MKNAAVVAISGVETALGVISAANQNPRITGRGPQHVALGEGSGDIQYT
jgi:hypothetical protein